MTSSAYKAFLIVAFAFWCAVAINLVFTLPSGFGPFLSIAGGVLLVIHGFDCLWYVRRFGKFGNSTLLDALLVLAAGAVHVFWISRQEDLGTNETNAGSEEPTLA